jgi:phage shock protein E
MSRRSSLGIRAEESLSLRRFSTYIVDMKHYIVLFLSGILIISGAAIMFAQGNRAAASSVKSSPRGISLPELEKLLGDAGSNIVLVDVRTREEFAEGRIPGALLFPFDELRARSNEFAALAGDKKRPIVVYCRTGRRSAIAADELTALGYTDVADFGGIDRWRGRIEK